MADESIDFRMLAGSGAPIRQFKAGDVIFTEGDPAAELFGNRVLEKLGRYGIFGEMALIDAAPRSATAVAATDVKLVAVGEKQFLFLVSDTPFFALNVMPSWRGDCGR